MIKLFLALLYLSTPTLQRCSTGCLKCSKTLDDLGQSVCVLCDQNLGFYLDGQTCKSSQESACLQYGLVGNCELCDASYYFDPNTIRCVPVPQQKLIQNCQYYNSDLTCKMCNTGFLIQNNVCVQLQSPVQNCDYQIVEGQCAECQPNYYLSTDLKTCSQIPVIEDCLSYSNIECEKCESGYLYDKNVFQRQLLKRLADGDTEKILNYLEHDLDDKYLFDTSIYKCEKIGISNCSEYTRFDQCKVCVSGYYLDANKKCVKNPQARISNCQIYTSLTNCLQCHSGYYRKNSQTCEKIKPSDHIQRCQQYSTTKSIIQCTKCEQEYYLSGNICKARVNQPIKFCQTYDVDEDVCGDCQVDYILSSDKLQCLQKILNCEQHLDFTSGSVQTDVKCDKCVQSHYLKDNECILGTQQNCESFVKDANQCSLCKEGYFSTPECILQSNIDHCVLYQRDEWNVCKTCTPSTYNLRVESKCIQLPEIANCKEYVDNSKLKKNLCKVCQDGFYRDNSQLDQRCLSITTSNCIQAEDNTGKCVKCKRGYGLAGNKDVVTCMAPLEAVTTYCHDEGLVQGNDNINNFQCNICQETASPLVQRQHIFPPFCVKPERLDHLLLYHDTYKTFRQIDKCVQYIDNTDEEYPLCNKCERGYSVSLEGLECIANHCKGQNNDNLVLLVSEIQTLTRGGNSYYYVQPEKCTFSNANFYVSGQDLTNINLSVLLSCRHNLKYVNLSDSKYSNVNPDNFERDWIQHFLDVFPRVSCHNQSNGAIVNGDTITDITTGLQTCQYYFMNSLNNYNCIRCPFGQQFSETPSTNNKLSTCRTMSSCDSTVEYKNINVYWQKLFSCHKCKTLDEIPVLAYDQSNKTNFNFVSFVPFSLSNADWKNTTINRSSQLFCMNVTDSNQIKTKLSLDQQAQVKTLTNCGLALLHLGYSNSFNSNSAMKDNNTPTTIGGSNEYALTCAQCKPGYKNIYFTSQKIVSFCETISNCDYAQNQTWFNACSQCETGYTYAYESNTIKWDKCVSYPHNKVQYANCLAWEIINQYEEACRVCKKGYTLNPENHFCEKLTIPTCSQFYIQNTNIDVTNNTAYFTYLNQASSGCYSCNSGMINVSQLDINQNYNNLYFPNLTICVKSDIVLHTTDFEPLTFYQQGTTNYQQSFYINHCLIHEVVRDVNTLEDFSTHKCYKCAEGYVLRNGGKKCELSTSYPNCDLLDQTLGDCLECKTGYALQRDNNGTKICIQGQIEKCLEYYTKTLLTSVRCKTCEDGYFFKDGKCVEGKVPYCIKYESEFVCTQCSDNFWLVGTADSSKNIAKGYYCLKKDQQLNCKLSYFTGQRFHCKECTNGSMKLVENKLTQSAYQNEFVLQSKCIEYAAIQNCEVHTKSLELESKSLYCEKCNRNYYIQDGGYLCKQRVNFQENCNEYFADQDKCSKCETGYFLNSQTNTCDKNPIGYLGCRKYQVVNNVLKCLSCGPGQYLENTECKKVSVENKISQCQYYKTATQCESCYPGYYFSNNLCKNITVDNCLEYVNENSCKKCKQGFRLLDKGENTLCELYDKLNCLEYDQYTLECKICNQTFFPDINGNCVQVVPNNLITNCEYYRSDSLCGKCGKDYVLSLDFKKCEPKGNFDAHCIQQRQIDIWDCNVCKSGFRFVGEICKTYDDTIQGCFIRDTENLRSCALCRSGYYMERGQNCALNV